MNEILLFLVTVCEENKYVQCETLMLNEEILFVPKLWILFHM